MSAILNFKNLQFLSSSPCRHAVLLPHTKFRWNRMSYGQKRDFQDGDRRHLKFQKFQFLVTWLSLGSISAVVYQILSKSEDFTLRYGDLAIFKMAGVRHLGFVMTSQYCIAGHIFVVQILSWNFLSIGFERGGGLKFGFLHWLASSPLQHSHYRATVWYHDYHI